MSAPERRSVLVGLLGRGIGPSLSPEMHEREAVRHGLRYVYKLIDLRPDELGVDRLRSLLEHAVRLGFDGLNVTHPVKQTMVSLVDDVSPDVEAIGALNTIVIRDGRTVGHNTDTTGFEAAFRDGLGDVARGHVVLLGAGGAGTAVAHALARLGVGRITVVDPDAVHGQRAVASLARLEGGPVVEQATPQQVADAVRNADGLVNASPVGMAAHPGLPVAAEVLRPDLWVADIVYRPLVTDLVRTGRQIGCQVLDGSGMAVHQAVAAYELFSGRRADPGAMARDLAELVSAEVDQSTPHVS